MLRFMLDTDICIYVIRDRPDGVRRRFSDAAGEICISTITLGELLYGAENSTRPAQNIRTVEFFTGRLHVLPFDAAAAAHYGQVRAALRRRGRPAGIHDMLIGAHARSLGLVLVTNTREFVPMSGLQIENWAVE